MTRRKYTPYRILVVHSDRAALVTLVDYLVEKGYEVDFAHNGKEGLKKLQIDWLWPDLVITDDQMPEMSGVELTAAIKNKRNGLPVILLVDESPDEHQADALLTKPLENLEMLLNEVREQLAQ